MFHQLIIGGRGTYDYYNLLLLDFKLSEPEPKYYRTDIPGGNGTIDQTGFGGDISYNDRTDEFTFGCFSDNFEASKNDLKNYLLGREFDYSLSWDPEYTYHGRFSLSDVSAISERDGTIKLSVTARPYKSKGTMTWLINAAGGVVINLPCGRKRQCPRIEVQRTSLISFEGKTWQLEAGTYKIRDLWLTQGDNEVVINTYPTYGTKTWADYATSTWAELADKRWYELAAGDDPVQVSDTWADYADKTWADVADKRWIELAHPAEAGDEYSAYIQYDWEDL